MKKVIALLILLIALATQAMTAEKYLSFVNKTDQEIKRIHLAPAGTNNWGPNLLDKWKLHPGKDYHVKVPHDEGNCMWDMKYVVREEMAYTIKDFNICKAVELEIFLQGKETWVNIK